MSQIILSNMTFDYNGHYKPVFQNVNLNLDTSWRLGLVGRNGRGKSTLLKLIHGELKPDSGVIQKAVTTELFPYTRERTTERTLDYLKNSVGELSNLEIQMEEQLKANTPKSLDLYTQLLSSYLERDGFTAESRIERELMLMGLSPELLDRGYETLSGGEKTKMQIISLFLKSNAFILMDEPTNHLDIDGKIALATYLSKKSGFIVVSHDREFLDQTADHILSIVRSDILLEKGNFSSWHNNRMLEDAFELRTHENLIQKIAVLEKSALESRRFSSIKESQKKGAPDKGAVGAQAARLMKRAKNTEHRRNRMLDDTKKLLKNHEPVSNLEISQEASVDTVLSVNNLSFGFGETLVISDLTFTLHSGDRLWIHGANGSGKSTLMNLLMGRLNASEGVIRFMPCIRISESYQEPLWKQGNLNLLLQEAPLNQAKFRTLLSYFDMHNEYFERPLETFSQGELKKIDIARALAQENHLLLLDEPLNYMDIYFREQLEKALLKYHPTLIFVEHDGHFGETVGTHHIQLHRNR